MSFLKMIFIDRLSIIGDKYFFDTFQPHASLENLALIKEGVESLLKSKEIISENDGPAKVIHFDNFEDRIISYIIQKSKYLSYIFFKTLILW